MGWRFYLLMKDELNRLENRLEGKIIIFISFVEDEKFLRIMHVFLFGRLRGVIIYRTLGRASDIYGRITSGYLKLNTRTFILYNH